MAASTSRRVNRETVTLQPSSRRRPGDPCLQGGDYNWPAIRLLSGVHMFRPVVRVLALCLALGTSVVVAQNRRALTAADYDRATRMLAPALNGLVVGGDV